MNIINEFFVSFILIKLYFKFKVCRKIKFPLLWKFYFSKWKFYFSADKNEKDYKAFLNLASKKVYLGWASRRKSSFLDPIFEHFNTHFKGFYESDLQGFLNTQNIPYEYEIFNETRVVKRDKQSAIENALWHLSMNGINTNKQELESFVKDEVEEIIEAKIKLLIIS